MSFNEGSAPAAAGAAPVAKPREQLGRARQLIETARFAAAASALREMLRSAQEPADEAEALYMLAVAERYDGRPADALATIERLLEQQPEHGRAHQERGHALLALQRPDEAADAYGRAVALNPGLIASFDKLAELHRAAGRAREADIAASQARFLGRLPPELLSVTGFIHENQLDKAETLCRHFLREHKHHVEGMRLLAEIAVRLKIFDEAEFLLESCVEFSPEYTPARIDYLNVLIRKMKFEPAYEQAKLLTERHPEDLRFRSSLATTLVGLGKFSEGIAAYRDVLERTPDNAEVRLLLGHALKTVGDTAAAVDAYRSAYRTKPDFGDAFWSLANTKTYEFSDAEIEQIRRAEQSAQIGVEDRIHMCFAAGKALEDRGDYELSFEYYQRGNDLKRAQTRYDAADTQRRIQAQIDTCTPELFERLRGVGCPRPDPIFIVGLPRAGSTLLEQILASHSMVDGTMELHNVLALAQRLRRGGAGKPAYPAILGELERDYFRRFGEQYLEHTQAYRAGAPFFIDKMPNNFLHIGLIRLMLPEAKIIDARREPMACCFSNYKQLFGEGQEFSYGLHEVGTYYAGYVRLMEHWDRVLPGFVLRVRHEDVVDDLETQVRRILDFCGLPFEDGCLQFHRTERGVRTPSSEQVRRPIYRSGLDAWRRYEAQLEPLKDALGSVLGQ